MAVTARALVNRGGPSTSALAARSTIPEGQPLAFGRPHMLVDNNYAKSVLTGRPGGMANYGSFTEYGGECVWWYCDRAQYLLGKRISDEMLDGAWLPS